MKNNQMSLEYRCTRNEPYVNPNCLGYADLGVRQGYYIKASCCEDAIAIMRERFPHDEAGFTVEFWKDLSVYQ